MGEVVEGLPWSLSTELLRPRPFSLFPVTAATVLLLCPLHAPGPVPPHLLHFVMLKNSSAGYFPFLSLIPPKPSTAGRAPLL